MSKHLGSGELAEFLREQLKPGDEASVLNEAYPHKGHIDGDLYQMGQDYRIRRTDRRHLKPGTYEEIDPTIFPWSDLKNFNP